MFVELDVKQHIYWITVSKRKYDVYYYVTRSLLLGKHWKIGQSHIFISNQVPSGDSQKSRMSTMCVENDDSQNSDGWCPLFYSPQKPLSPQTSTISREDITIINCVKQLARRLQGNRRKYAGGEVSQFKADIEALQAGSIFLSASKWEQKIGNASAPTLLSEWEFNPCGPSDVLDSKEFSISRGPSSNSNRLIILQCFTVVCPNLLSFCGCFWTPEIWDFLENLFEPEIRNLIE